MWNCVRDNIHFSRTLLCYVRLAWAVRRCCLPVVCLSVTLLHPRQWLVLFGVIFAWPNSSGTQTVCIKILSKNSNRFWVSSCKLNTRGYEKLAFSTNISFYFENNTRYGQSYNGRRIGTRMRFIERCHFQWSWVTPNPDFKGMQRLISIISLIKYRSLCYY